MAKRWFPGTVFGFCSGTLLVIGLGSLRTDHPAVGKQASWTHPTTHDVSEDVNPWLEMEDETGEDLAEIDESDAEETAGVTAAEGESAVSNEASENRLEPASAAHCPAEEFFAQISEFRYRYLFQGRDELGFFATESLPSVAADDEPATAAQAAPELALDEAADTEAYDFYEEYGPGEPYATAAELPEAEVEDQRDGVDYEALDGDYYEEARPQEVVGGRPWLRRRNARQASAPKASEDAASAKPGMIQFPTLAEYAGVHVEEDWEARVAETWILARNDMSALQSDEHHGPVEDRFGSATGGITADGDEYAGSPWDTDFDMVRDESLEPLFEDDEREMSGEVSLPIPEEDRDEAAPVWDTPMHGEPGEDFQWDESREETAVEFPAFPALDSAAADGHDFEANGDDAWDLEKPGYSPASNAEEVSHIYQGEYNQSEKYRYFVYEEGYRGWKELNAALSAGDDADSVRLEVFLPALLRAMDSLPEFLGRAASDARRSLAESMAWLLNRPRTAAKPDSTSVQ